MTNIKRELDDLLKRYKELEVIINKSPVVVFLWKNEEDWPVEFVSENITQFGYTREEFMSGKIKYSEMIYPEDLERVTKEVATYCETNLTEFTQEYRIFNKSKEILWVDDRTFIRRNSDGEITHFQGVILEITEKKKILQDLENSERKFRMISEQILVGIGIIQDGKIVYANKKAVEIFGYSLEEMKNWLPGEFAKTIHPDDLKREVEYIDQIQTDPNINEIQFRTRGLKKSGELFWADALFKKFILNNRPALIGMFIDITERKKAENALRFTQFTVDHSSEPAFWLDDQFSIFYVNEAMCKSLGYSREELVKMKGFDISPNFPKDAWRPTWEKIKEKGSIIIETDHQKKNGEFFPIEAYINYIKYDNKEYNCIFARDISERKESERKLKKSEEKYREAFHRENFYKDLFTHDMRNILQSICTSLELYELNFKSKTGTIQNDEFLENIHSQIDRATHLINNIKKFSDLDSFEQSLIRMNIYQIVQQIINNIQNSSKNKRISVKVEPNNQSKFLILGNELLNEAIENILLNSIIHNDNEEVFISIRILKVLGDEKPFIRVEFSDNGRGIEDSRKKIIFNRAYNQNKSTIGMGLGLSLVKKIIENLDGLVWVEDRITNDYKQGSKFILLLPEVD
ncbi:MAG: PAS domain S-box protein [Promethearchaeota archaeon]